MIIVPRQQRRDQRGFLLPVQLLVHRFRHVDYLDVMVGVDRLPCSAIQFGCLNIIRDFRAGSGRNIDLVAPREAFVRQVVFVEVDEQVLDTGEVIRHHVDVGVSVPDFVNVSDPVVTHAPPDLLHRRLVRIRRRKDRIKRRDVYPLS